MIDLITRIFESQPEHDRQTIIDAIDGGYAQHIYLADVAARWRKTNPDRFLWDWWNKETEKWEEEGTWAQCKQGELDGAEYQFKQGKIDLAEYQRAQADYAEYQRAKTKTNGNAARGSVPGEHNDTTNGGTTDTAQTTVAA